MIIQHNIMALNAHRQLGGNNSLVQKNLEKLSSGYKINRAGDDAAGLAISEKMRAQITGLTRAQANAQDGISLVQTAEGALTEVHSMLNRMVDLATQSANGTLKDEDRLKIQDEMTALETEITRISKATDFNGIKLLDGSLGGAKITSVDGAPDPNGTAAVAAVYGSKLTITGDVGDLAVGDSIGDGTNTLTVAAVTDFTKDEISIADAADAAKVASYFASKTTNTDYNLTANGDELVFTAKTPGAIAGDGPAAAPNTTPTLTYTVAAAGKTVTATFAAIGAAKVAGADATGTPSAASTELDFTGKIGSQMFGGTMKIGNTTYEFVETGKTAAAGNTAIELGAADDATAIATKVAAGIGVTGFTASSAGSVVSIDEDAATGSTKAPTVEFAKLGLSLQIGDTAEEFNKVTVSVADMSAKGLGIDNITVGTQGVSDTAIADIKKAINTVSVNRSAMGALQNRLEHTINNLAVTTENMTAAESRIRDVDMAKEMMQFTKNNVLSQAAQAMLAQANQQPQQVLQLLR